VRGRGIGGIDREKGETTDSGWEFYRGRKEERGVSGERVRRIMVVEE